jgi:hypothetical protein
VLGQNILPVKTAIRTPGSADRLKRFLCNGYKPNPPTVTIVIEVKYGTEYIITISPCRL